MTEKTEKTEKKSNPKMEKKLPSLSEGHRERLRQRMLKSNLNTIDNYELLEALLFYAIPRVDTKPLAKNLLKKFNNSLPSVLHGSIEQMKQFSHIGDATIMLFAIVREISRRMAKEDLKYTQELMSSWEALVNYCRANIGHKKHECFHVLYLNQAKRLITDDVLQEGTIDMVNFSWRELIKNTLNYDASGLVMVHNHPSGQAKPSRQDIDVTRKIRDLLSQAQIGVKLLDHIIITRSGYYSFEKEGEL